MTTRATNMCKCGHHLTHHDPQPSAMYCHECWCLQFDAFEHKPRFPWLYGLVTWAILLGLTALFWWLLFRHGR